jgi:hypothetical protein
MRKKILILRHTKRTTPEHERRDWSDVYRSQGAPKIARKPSEAKKKS